MPLIFVNTDNSDPKNKPYDGKIAGKSAAKAEEMMQKVVVKAVGKASGFTTIKTDNAKGYTIRLTVTKVAPEHSKTKCSLTGEIVRFPDNEMVSLKMTGNGAVTGNSEDDALACIEALAEDLATKSIPIMRENARP